MAHIVTCIYCKKRFDRDKEPFVAVSSRRYAHETCPELTEDEQKLYDYIKKVFKTDNIDEKIHRQINKYITEYNYTHSGILKALVYHFEIKHGSVEKANNGIGIVPYIYQEAYNYYYTLWLAQQINTNKNIADYIPEVKEITISPPKRKIKKRKIFTFLDEEEI